MSVSDEEHMAPIVSITSAAKATKKYPLTEAGNSERFAEMRSHLPRTPR